MSVASRFMGRFAGLGRAHGTYTISKAKGKQGTKVGGRAKTVKEPITELKWEDHLKGNVGIGIVPVDDEGTACFGAIDVDVYDLNLEALEKKVKTTGLPLIVCRTKSGGAHLYLFTQKRVSAGLIRDKLMEWSIALGHPAVEVFPKQSELAGEDDVGSWINMPYFTGSRTTRYAIRDAKALSPTEFLKLADKIAVTEETLKAVAVKQDEMLSDGPPCLQHLAAQGFPEGTRNKALFNLGVFCRQKFGDDWKVKLDEFNQKYLLPPLPTEEVRTIVKSLGRKDYFYTCKDAPITQACNKAICARRKYGIGSSKNDPGVVMDGLVKILTDPPLWLVNVDGKRLRLETTDHLIDQTRFIRVCMDEFSILPNRVTRPIWDDVVRGLLDKVEEVEAPEDAGVTGQFLFLLEQFCTEQAHARNREELLIGKPYTEEEWTYFRSPDMLRFMETRRLRITAKEAWNILRDVKAKTKQFKVKGKCVRCWGVQEFAQHDGDLDTPEIDSEDF